MAYFKLGEAFKELTSAVGAADTAVAGAKLLGKTVFNTGKLVVEGVIKQNESTSEKVLKRDDLSDEQRSKWEDMHQKSKDARVKWEIGELDDKIAEKRSFLSKDDLSFSERREIEDDIEALERDKERLLR